MFTKILAARAKMINTGRAFAGFHYGRLYIGCAHYSSSLGLKFGILSTLLIFFSFLFFKHGGARAALSL